MHTHAKQLYNYIEMSETSVRNRRALQDEVDTLNQAVKDGLSQHVSRDAYQPIAHRNEWDDEAEEAAPLLCRSCL